VPETQTRRERVNLVDLLTLPAMKIVDDLDNPVVVLVANRGISVARDLVVQLCDRCGDIVRVKVSTRGLVHEANGVAVLEVADWSVQIDARLLPAWGDNPVVICVFVVIACHLLLVGADRVGLNVGVQEAASPAHVFQRYFRTERDLCTQ